MVSAAFSNDLSLQLRSVPLSSRSLFSWYSACLIASLNGGRFKVSGFAAERELASVCARSLSGQGSKLLECAGEGGSGDQMTVVSQELSVVSKNIGENS